MTMYDLVVVGAGPGGSAAAYHASRGGLRVLIVDRVPFPRAKTCGDALVPSAVRALARMGITDIPGHPVRGLKLVDVPSGTERIEAFEEGTASTGLVVPRSVLDDALLKKAQAAGATFLPARARRIVPGRTAGHVVVLDTESGPRDVRTHVVVVATGSGSIAPLLGGGVTSRRHVWGIAGRTYANLSEPLSDLLEAYFPLVHEGRVLSGFSWIFPVGGTRANIGIGVFRSSETAPARLASLLDAFISQRARDDPRFHGASVSAPMHSASIPIGPDIPAIPGILPVGDCAGLAHGLTAEGIGAALASGELAAQVVVERPGDPAAVYRQRLRELLPRQFRLGPALVDLHARPHLAVGRGWDILGRPHRTAGRALRRLLLDQPAGAPAIHNVLGPKEREAATRIGELVFRDVQRLRPILGELVLNLLGQPEVAFGWYASFGAAVREAAFPSAPDLPVEALRMLAILETANLVTVLHSDLLPVDVDTARDGTWGRNTLGLVLADCLTARALQHLYALDGVWMRYIATVASRVFRTSAEAHLESARASAMDGLKREALVAAVQIATLTNPSSALPPAVERAIGLVMAARATSAIQTAWPQVVALLRDSFEAPGNAQCSPIPPEAPGSSIAIL